MLRNILSLIACHCLIMILLSKVGKWTAKFGEWLEIIEYVVIINAMEAYWCWRGVLKWLAACVYHQKPITSQRAVQYQQKHKVGSWIPLHNSCGEMKECHLHHHRHDAISVGGVTLLHSFTEQDLQDILSPG